jgi:RNA:NAD 2'-phosphotransferase (TPT1/KptA family)
MLRQMKRRTVSLSDKALEALEQLARQHKTNVSCVVEAAAAVIADGGAGARSVEQRIVPDRRGGHRVGSGRKKTI